MCGIDQAERRVLGGLGGRVVAQVRGEEGVHAGGAHRVEEAVARSSAHRDGAHERVRVAGEADALRGGGQPGGGAGGEGAQGLGVVEHADPAESAAPRGVRRVRYEGALDAQVEGGGQGVGDTRVGGVGVGVGDVQRDAVPDQRVDDAALEGVRRDRRRTAQVERVVGHDQVRPQLLRLVGDRLDGVDGEEHPVDLGVRITADGADRVPTFGPLGRPEGVELGDDIRQTGHGGKATCPPRPREPRERAARRRSAPKHTRPRPDNEIRPSPPLCVKWGGSCCSAGSAKTTFGRRR
ncbi:hypothetical protein SAMN05216483_4572 [Streptomyces sp. 2131.1]|nr:hypothetical protein SAMN05216483_4572 [Streptomyces sp. 2131.1]